MPQPNKRSNRTAFRLTRPNQKQSQPQNRDPNRSRSPFSRQNTSPGPALLPEPDMYATDDIENLISQSFVETVEMPYTVAERVMSEISDQEAKQSSDQPTTGRPDDVAFDDELIETTFTNEPGDSIEQSELIQDKTLVEERIWESASPHRVRRWRMSR